MNTDEHQSNAAGSPSNYPAGFLKQDHIYDAFIYGGGIAGLTAAILLQAAGKQCVIADGADLIASSLNAAPFLFTYKHTDTGYNTEDITNAGAAIDLVEELVLKYAINCDLLHLPSYVTSSKNIPQLDTLMSFAKKAGLVVSEVQHTPFAIPLGKTYRIEYQSIIHTDQYISGLIDVFRRLGGILLNNCTLGSIDYDQHCIATTSAGIIHSEKVVTAEHLTAQTGTAIAFTRKTNNYPEAIVHVVDASRIYVSSKLQGKDCIIAFSESGYKGDDQLQHNMIDGFDADEILDQREYQYPDPNCKPEVTCAKTNRHFYTIQNIHPCDVIGGSHAARVLFDLFTGVQHTH